ncbi:carbonic anhydrase [Halorubrum sp. CSM-61]|jgi:carbonic anhydrase|uniref:carbonic anhydrase n=1 Tax=Halorubrum sp. CSM-61 TaxID=2485838 RepID=UPI000F4CF52C|nr:carbonic anhydrase [Halorubrum sp. CSM-61]
MDEKDDIASVIESVQDWTESRRDSVHESDAQTALVVSCSMSNCKHQGSLWPVDATWNVVGVQTLGNQTRERYEGETVLDSNIEHLRTQYEITAVLVVGHTRCEVLEDAYERWVAPDSDSPAGIEARLDPLVSLVEDGFERGLLAESMPLRTVRNRLVEYNVRQQVRFLQQALPPSVTIAGYVHDQDGEYSSFPDKWYLVTLDGETEPTTIRTHLPEDTSVHVAGLLT